MPTSDPLQILLRHNLWATRQMIDAAAKLSEEQFHQRFEMGPGSVHDTLQHMMGAMRVWADVLAGREVRPRLEQQGVRRTPGELHALLNEVSADLAASAVAHPLNGTVVRKREDKTYTLTRGAVLMQVLTHGMHHRAQILNMLRRLGVTPLPHSSVVEWVWAGEG
jgi:uncharacterized damage-inducible protein DinB